MLVAVLIVSLVAVIIVLPSLLQSQVKKDPTPVAQRNAVCLDCHEKTSRLHWQGSPHELRDLACTNCHRVMENHSERGQLTKATEIETCGECHIERRAQLMRSSHMPLREGKMTCSAAQNTAATTMDFPKIINRLHQFEAALKYHLTPAAFVRFRYIFETFDITDFRTDDLQPFMGGTDIFLGAQVRDYTTHVFAFMVGYKF
jgi:hypothetical protein